MRRGLLLGFLVWAGALLTAASASAVIYSPTSVQFGEQQIGGTAPSVAVQVGGGGCGADYYDPVTHSMAPGYCTSERTDIAVSGPFVITANTCPVEIYPKYHAPGWNVGGYSCAVSIAFVPTQVGAATGFLRLTNTTLKPDGTSSPVVAGVPLSGTAVIPAATLRKKCKKHHAAAAAAKKKCKKRKR